MRLVLARSARFDAVDEHLQRCGLELAERVSQVFPARPEPADAWWVGPDGVVAARFGYIVNPDRRTLDLFGPDAADLARAARTSLGEITFAEIEGQLMQAEPDAAFVAAFLASATGDPRAVDLLCRGLASRDDYVGTGCLRALELVGDHSVVPLLHQLRQDTGRAGDLRLLAAEVANSLQRDTKAH